MVGRAQLHLGLGPLPSLLLCLQQALVGEPLHRAERGPPAA